MAANPNERPGDATMDPAALYREEIYTDRRVGTLRVLMPVRRDGSPDSARKTVYSGEAQILNLSVVPDARRQGLGRALLERFVDDALRTGADQIFLEVRVSNTAAIALYRSAGFEPVARRTNYYPASLLAVAEDALVMRKHLRT